MPISILDTIMDTLKGVEKDQATLTVDEGGKNIDLFEDKVKTLEEKKIEFHEIMGEDAPEVWKVSSETFDTLDTGGKGDMDIFLRKGQQLGTMMDDPENVLETISSDKLQAMGDASGQNIETIIDQFSWTDRGRAGGATMLQGVTKSGKNYKFNLVSYEDKGERVYEINGDRLDKDNWNATVKNITEKLDNVSLAVSEKFEEGDTLSGEEYLSATTQEPKITVGESYSSPRHMMDEVKVTPEAEERKKPWWQ